MKPSRYIFHDKLKIIERLSYLLVCSPFLIDYLSDGKVLYDERHIVTEVTASVLILIFSIVLSLTRREIAKLNRLRQTLTEAIVHDLKNPLTSIMSSVSFLLEEDGVDPKRRKTLLELALRGCRTELHLIETLLDVDQLEMSVLTPRKDRLDVDQLLDSCIGDIAGAADFAGLKIRKETEPMPELYADRDLLKRVFINLLNNSIKYSSVGGEITLQARYSPTDGIFHFQVRDNGIGIAKEHLDQLFNKFYRVEGTDQSRRRGTGLGLYFCRLVVEAHRGKIHADSAVGQGTAVFVDIPQPVMAEKKDHFTGFKGILNGKEGEAAHDANAKTQENAGIAVAGGKK